MTQRVQAAAAAVVVSLLLVASLQRPQKQVCDGFLPPNNLNIPVGHLNAGGVTEDEFNEVLDRVEKIYAPIIAAKGNSLVVNRFWEDGTVNAYAYQEGTVWNIAMFGGLARHELVTKDGFAVVACHELGHHLGGHPRMGWATNEGGADYFSTLKCLRRYYAGQKRQAEIDPIAKAGCEKEQPETAREACINSAMAGLSVSKLLGELGGEPVPQFGTPDPAVVEYTYDWHPAAQCRLDTYFNGALCTKAVDEDVADDNEATGACTTAAGFTSGTRPLCWYKPPTPVEPGNGELPPAVATRHELPDVQALDERLNALKSALSGNGI